VPMADPVFQALGLQEFEPQQACGSHGLPRGGLLPPSSWPNPIAGPFGAEACLPEVYQPNWPAVAHAAALQATTAAYQDSLARGAPLDMQQFMAAQAWAAVAASVAAPHPFFGASSSAFLPQPLPASLAQTRPTFQATATAPDVDKREVSEDAGMAELDLAVTKLLEGCDDSCSIGHLSGFGDEARLLCATPPPRGFGEPLHGTPSKVASASARTTSPAPPPGLQKRHVDNQTSSPVQLNLSSMAFPGGSAFSKEKLLPAPPGIAAPNFQDKEGGAFLLNLLRSGSTTNSAEPAAPKGSREDKAAPPSPTTASSTSNAGSPSTASTGDTGTESAGARRPTRRGRRAGQTRYQGH